MLQQLATPQELKDRPANLFVASFIGEPPMNVLRGAGRARWRAKAGGAEPGRGRRLRPAPAHDGTAGALATRRRVHLGIRPHLIDVGDAWPAQRHASSRTSGSATRPISASMSAAPAGHRGGRRDRCAGAEHGAGLAAGRIAASLRRRERCCPDARPPAGGLSMAKDLLIGIDAGTSMHQGRGLRPQGPAGRRGLDAQHLRHCRGRRGRAGHGADLAGHRGHPAPARRHGGGPAGPRGGR